MQVLVSVTSAAEAQLVLSAGVSLIDLKDTSHGALAALELGASISIVETVRAYHKQAAATAAVISATVGDDCISVADLVFLIESRLDIGVEVIKLPETIWDHPVYQSAIDVFLAAKVKMIAVLTPDSLAAETMAQRLRTLGQKGYWGVMVDTTNKSSSLVELVTIPVLAEFVRQAKALDLFVGIAGGLLLEHFDALVAVDPDYMGFRSGLCINQQRSQPLMTERVQKIVSRVS